MIEERMELHEIMELICNELGYSFVSDLRQEKNQDEVLKYIISHTIEYKDKETYKKLIQYIME